MTSIDEIIANLDQKQFIDDWNRGVSFKELKKKFGLYRELAIKVAKSFGLKERITKPDMHTEHGFDFSEFEKDWDSGMSLADLIKKHHLTYSEKARRIAKQLGLQNIQRNPSLKILSKLNVIEFTEDWNSGMLLDDLKAKYGLAYKDQANRIAKYLHLPKRSSSHRRFENIDIKKFSEMYLNKDFRVKKIQKEFNFADPGYVSRLAKELRLPIRSSRTNPSEDGSQSKLELYKDQFKQSWEEGAQKQELAKIFQISTPTVYLWAKKLNLKPRPRGGFTRNYYEKIEKIITLLVNNNGALTTRKLISNLNIGLKNLRQYTSDTAFFDSLNLELKFSSAKYKASSYFGDDTGRSIIFLKGRYDCLLLKLASILSESKIHKTHQLKGDFYHRAIRILSIKQKILIENSDLIFDLINSSIKRDELKNKITRSLKTYDITKHIKSIINKTPSSRDPFFVQIDPILKNSQGTIFFGRKINKDEFLKKMDNSDITSQKSLMKQLFLAMNMYCEDNEKNPFYDFKIFRDTTYYIKLMIHQLVSKTDLDVLLGNIKNDRGIIVTLQEVEENLLDAYNDRIVILTKNRLEKILSYLRFLPSQQGDICKIMYGESKGNFVSVQEINHKNSTAGVIELLRKNVLSLPLGSLKAIYQNKEKENLSSHFAHFLENISKISSDDALKNLDRISDIELFQNPITSNGKRITAKVSGNLVSLKFEGENRYIGNLIHLNGVDYCRYHLISCNCLAWLDQLDDVNLCKHIANLLFYLWDGNQ